MDFEYSDRTKALLEKLHKFMDEVIYPAEPVYEEQMEKAKDRWQLPPVIEECKAEAKKRGSKSVVKRAVTRLVTRAAMPPINVPTCLVMPAMPQRHRSPCRRAR